MGRYILLAIAGAILAVSCAIEPAPHKATAQPKPSAIEGYQTWHKVNPERVRVAAIFAYLCRLTTPEEDRLDASDPHKDKFITVYVNPAGKPAMTGSKVGPFPVGSIIVKEKHTTATSKTAELMTVMVKREKGFNPACGDWEFSVYKPGAAKPLEEGKLQACQNCHVKAAGNDYVIANYRPGKDYKFLRWMEEQRSRSAR